MIFEIGNILFVIVLVWALYYLPTKLAYGTTLLQQYKIYRKTRNNIKSLVKQDWEIASFNPFSISKTQFKDYEVYVKVINKKTRQWTNDFVEIDENGKILSENLTANMKFWTKHRK